MTKEEKDELIQCLETLMADTLAFKLKSQFCHHHVSGLEFSSLHDYFEEIYSDMEEAYDEIGEQIIILGGSAPGSFREHLNNSRLGNFTKDRSDMSTKDMVDTLQADNDKIRDFLADCEETAAEIGVENVLDFFVERHREHDMHHYKLTQLSMV